MKNNIALIVGLMWISFLVGMTIEDVGKQFIGGTYDWGLPLTAIILFGGMFLIGFWAGQDSNK